MKHITISEIINVKEIKIKHPNIDLIAGNVATAEGTQSLIDNGADIMSVKELLGHTSLSSTQIYTHVKIEKLKKEYKKSHPHGK